MHTAADPIVVWLPKKVGARHLSLALLIPVFGVLAIGASGCDAKLGDDWYRCRCICTNFITGFETMRVTDACADSADEAVAACGAACDNAEAWGLSLSDHFPFINIKIDDCRDDATFERPDACPSASSYRVMSTETADSIRAEFPPLIIGSGSSPRITFRYGTQEIVVDLQEGEMNPSNSGEVIFAGGICPGKKCSIHFERVDIDIPGPNFVDGKKIEDFRAVNINPFFAEVEADGDIVLTGTAKFAASVLIDGEFQSQEGLVTAWDSSIDVGNRKFVINMTIENDATIIVEDVPAYFYVTPPIAIIDAPTVAECAVPVTLDGSNSFDPDGDSIETLDWYESLQTANERFLGSGAVINADFDVGSRFVGLFATGPDNRLTLGGHIIEVEDTIAPEFDPSGSLCLWPPSHDYIVLDLKAASFLLAGDACDPNPKVEALEAISSQPDDGIGDGSTTDDAVLLSPSEVCFRVERAGTEIVGRTYDLQLQASDASGNTRQGQFEIAVVPHDRRNGRPCLQTRGEPGTPLRQVDACPVAVAESSGCASTQQGFIGNGLSAAGLASLLLLFGALVRRRFRRSKQRS